jgi:predicted peptidase
VDIVPQCHSNEIKSSQIRSIVDIVPQSHAPRRWARQQNSVKPECDGASTQVFVNLDNAEKREDSVKDIGALLDWVSSQPDLDSKRIAIWGGSYGGYMCLAGLVHFPDRFVCGIDNVGISNFVTFLENTAG